MLTVLTDHAVQQALMQNNLTDLLSENKLAQIEHMMQISVVEDENMNYRKTLTVEIDYNCQDRLLLQCNVIHEKCIVTNEKTKQTVAEIIQTDFVKQITQKILTETVQTMQMIQMIQQQD